MLYTEDFTMRHYVGFSQIGSHIVVVTVTAHSVTIVTMTYWGVLVI